jgi:hypothetical protein
MNKEEVLIDILDKVVHTNFKYLNAKKINKNHIEFVCTTTDNYRSSIIFNIPELKKLIKILERS